VTPTRPTEPSCASSAIRAPGGSELLAETLALGVCGTDREILSGEYGWSPPGSDHLVLGHEWLGRVRAAPADTSYAAGDLLAGVLRRPDSEPCPCCARGQFDCAATAAIRGAGSRSATGTARTSSCSSRSSPCT
jgi:glucose 1-dehydrogenase